MTKTHKNFLKILLVVIASIIAGRYIHKCQSPADEISGRRSCITDTVTVCDTIPYINPVPVLSLQTGYKRVKIPKGHIDRNTDIGPVIRADTARQTCTDITAGTADSITVRLPITQNVYEGEGYKAYVSGIYPRLDSVFVNLRHETITIREPPKRWHIGPTIGYGYTPHGFGAYIGVSMTYSIISF